MFVVGLVVCVDCCVVGLFFDFLVVGVFVGVVVLCCFVWFVCWYWYCCCVGGVYVCDEGLFVVVDCVYCVFWYLGCDDLWLEFIVDFDVCCWCVGMV